MCSRTMVAMLANGTCKLLVTVSSVSRLCLELTSSHIISNCLKAIQLSLHCCHLCEPLHTATHSAAGLNAPHSAAGLNAVACAARGRVQRGHGRPPPCQLPFAHICALMFLLSPSSSSQLHAFVSGLISFFDQSIKPVPTRGWFCLPVAFIGCLLTFAHPSLIPEAHYPSPHLPFPLICTCHHPSPPLTASHMHALSCLRVFIHSPTLPRLSPNSATCSTCCAPPPPPS